MNGYRAEESKAACAHCFTGAEWSVVAPSGEYLGITFTGPEAEENATEYADALQDAFLVGRASTVAEPVVS